jgi:ubiquinone/menaquinone biosynthesis C-methylase UbiE
MNTKEYWEAERKKVLHLAEEDLFADYWTKRYLENLKYLNRGRRILDIGCGNAKYFIKLTDKFKEFYGVELSEIHFETAKKLFPSGNYIVADANKLPFENCFFDAVISFGAFEHNEDIDSIFKECYRVLDKNGVLLFSVPNYFSLYFPYCSIFHTLRGHDRTAAIGHYYTKKELISKLKEQSFSKIEIIDSIYAAPVPIIGLVAGLATRFIRKMCNIQSYANPVTNKTGWSAPQEHLQRDKFEKFKRYVKKLDYYYSKVFYPFERLGFGFMRVVLCYK